MLNYGVGPILKGFHNLVAIIQQLTFQSHSLTFESQLLLYLTRSRTGAMPKKGANTSGTRVSDKERQCLAVILLEARESLPKNSMPTSEQHATVKKNLVPALNKLRDEGISPPGVNLEVLAGVLGEIEGLAAMNKCAKLKCSIRDKSGKLWEIINTCWDPGHGNWKSGTQLPDVKRKILEALWDEKEQMRVGVSQERNGEGPLSPGAKPGAKATKAAQKYEAGNWLGPPWWPAFERFLQPSGCCQSGQRALRAI